MGQNRWKSGWEIIDGGTGTERERGEGMTRRNREDYSSVQHRRKRKMDVWYLKLISTMTAEQIASC